ncbi:di-trans,poly-cis-decaprenylcistransferase [Trichinella nativa]|uniref:ditrans,polycis-polyprenyl diphosphate synthase [(2E,6E)-farnesyldiphosphate specific] n=1 Tax=Trichinella nativa TaxID=6335 RepID=A0A1Y3EFX3_9BILA|nr:di-trans,poly-cis-decaprenylcistransferase [Trichinella nativa]
MKDETSVLVISLLNDKNGKRTAQCLALRLANVTSKLFSGNTLYSPSVTVFDSEDFNDSFGVTRLHERLQSFFSQYIYNVAIMKEFQNFSPITCDMDLSSVGYEKSYDKHIYLCLKNSAFAQTHSEDHFAALLSRIGGSVAIVTPEEDNLDHAFMPTLFSAEKLSWLQRMMAKLLSLGPIPQHIAFIMDGNRRFATKLGMEATSGHEYGYETLMKTLQWCRKVGIREVTVFALSIENFKRSEAEVNALMNLARVKFAKILETLNSVEENNVRCRFFGNFDYLPEDVRELMEAIALKTRENKGLFLNICFPYTAFDELRRACISIMKTFKANGQPIEEDQLTVELISKHLDSGCSTEPDLLIRTSGETRLSDFLLWQLSYSCLYFDPVLWPDYSFWNLFRAILFYQQNYEQIQEVRKYGKISSNFKIA